MWLWTKRDGLRKCRLSYWNLKMIRGVTERLEGGERLDWQKMFNPYPEFSTLAFCAES
jgi:hypothetical protein